MTGKQFSVIANANTTGLCVSAHIRCRMHAIRNERDEQIWS